MDRLWLYGASAYQDSQPRQVGQAKRCLRARIRSDCPLSSIPGNFGDRAFRPSAWHNGKRSIPQVRRDTRSETASTIRFRDAIPSPLEHSHQTHIQTYGLMVKPISQTYLPFRCAYTGEVGRRVARTSPPEAWPMRDGRRLPPPSGFRKGPHRRKKNVHP